MKASLLLSLFISLLIQTAFGQGGVPKKLLIEQFTNASCPPCAANNPSFDALLKTNELADRIVPLKYQTNWPGPDPMNALNPSDVISRINYYGINSVPNYSLDGTSPENITLFAQSKVDVAPDSTPFRLNLTHTLSKNLDSIRIEVVIKNESSDTLTAKGNNSLKLHLALIQEELHFPSAPGFTSETEFNWGMREMYPNANGTSLSNTWLPGQTETFIFQLALPDFIFEMREVATVAFIQDNQDKSIYQAENTHPTPITSGIVETSVKLTNLADQDLCTTNFLPEFYVYNEGPDTLEGFIAAITYGPNTNYTPWSGTLLPMDSVLLQGDPLTIPQLIEVSVELLNYTGSVEGNRMDPPFTKSLGSVQPNIAPFSEGFEQVIFNPLPAGINPIIDPALDAAPLMNTSDLLLQFSGKDLGAFGLSKRSLMFSPFAESFVPRRLGFITDKFDLSSSAGGALTFSLAYKHPSQVNSDTLEVYASVDCGKTWTTIYSKFGPFLATKQPDSDFFFYPDSGDWKTETIQLNDFAMEEVIFKFEIIGRIAHSLYIDDLQVAAYTVGIEDDLLAEAISVYPNPFSQTTQIEIQMDQEAQLAITVLDLTGRIISQQTVRHFGGISSVELDATNWNPGIYQAVIRSEQGQIVRKLQVVE